MIIVSVRCGEIIFFNKRQCDVNWRSVDLNHTSPNVGINEIKNADYDSGR